MNPPVIPPSLQAGLGRELGGAFYLHGSDAFRREEAARALVEAHLDPGTRDFNLDTIRGSEIDAETLASILGTPPMMAEWRVVVLHETEALAGSPRTREFVLNAVRTPLPGLALILLCTVPDRSSARFYRDLEKLARSMAFQDIGSDDVPGWLIHRARTHLGRELEEDAARALGQAVGPNLAYLARELEKLDALAEQGEPITTAHVDATGTRIPRQDRWQWFDRVAEKRYQEALDGLEILLQHGESGVGLTLGLATHLLRLGVVVDGGTGALEALLPPHQKWLSRRYGSQARRWSGGEVEAAVQDLLELDRLLKSSTFSDQHLLESWILKRMAGAVAA
ncbi:MAG: DNA polymerase III subunit delta [Gemmatimonadales bacterium]|nr:MAG: DNA polymerase III subunit delta [Gemmatimonadales bacterium]